MLNINLEDKGFGIDEVLERILLVKNDKFYHAVIKWANNNKLTSEERLDEAVRNMIRISHSETPADYFRPYIPQGRIEWCVRKPKSGGKQQAEWIKLRWFFDSKEVYVPNQERIRQHENQELWRRRPKDFVKMLFDYERVYLAEAIDKKMRDEGKFALFSDGLCSELYHDTAAFARLLRIGSPKDLPKTKPISEKISEGMFLQYNVHTNLYVPVELVFKDDFVDTKFLMQAGIPPARLKLISGIELLGKNYNGKPLQISYQESIDRIIKEMPPSFIILGGYKHITGDTAGMPYFLAQRRV